VNLAASLAWHFSHENAEISFVIPGSAPDDDLHELLARLAVIAPLAAEPGAVGKTKIQKGALRDEHLLDENALKQLDLSQLGPSPSDQYNIVLRARPKGSIPTELWNSSHFVFIGEDGGKP
jgi:hypothetical protein